jgi:beta propeller repeat protein
MISPNRASFVLGGLAAILFAGLAAADSGSFYKTRKLVPSDGSLVVLDGGLGLDGDEFGWSVAIDGGLAIVGSHRDDDAGEDSGSAYVFSVATGQQLTKLLPTPGYAREGFGKSVAISGTTAVVAGNAAYQFNAMTGQLVRTLVPTTGPAGPSCVDIHGSLAIVGVSDAAYVFDTTTGAQVAKLLPNDGPSGWFGSSVAISGDICVVGASLDNDKGEWSGSAYVFNARTGTQLAKLLASDGAPYDIFGRCVDMCGDRVIVGSWGHDEPGRSECGAAYIFDAGTGAQIARLLPSDIGPYDSFGTAVGISEDLAVVGAYAAAAAYVFNVDTGEQLAELTPDPTVAITQFGISAAVCGNVVIVGDRYDHYMGPSGWEGPGAAYLFVPEPAALSLLVLGGLALIRRRRGRRCGLVAPMTTPGALRASVACMALVVVGGTHAARGELSSFPICAQGADQHHAAVSGNWVVWLDDRSAQAYPDIYGKDLSTGREVAISTGGATYNYWPGVDGDIVVWADNRSGNWDVYGLDLALYKTFGFDPSERQKCEFPICVAAGNQVQPTVSGHTVVWIGGNADVHGRYLLSGPEFTICVNPAIAWRPEISGRLVVWNDMRLGDKNVYGRRLYTSDADFPICTHPADQDGVSVDGDRVVWHDDRNANRDIYGFDLSTGTEFPICLNPANQWRTRVSGDIVVWHDERNFSTQREDIYGYDLSTDSEFSVCLNAAAQQYPAVSGRLVVWQDSRNGNLDIYGAIVPEGAASLPPVITGCQASAEYDPNGHQRYSTGSIGPDAVLVGGTLALEDFALTDEYATIRMYYNEQEVLGANIEESSLRLYWWSEPDGSWLLAGNASNLTDNSAAPDFQGFVPGWPTQVLGDWGLNMDENYVWANVDHASVFSISGVPEPATLSLLALGGCLFLLLGKRANVKERTATMKGRKGNLR